MAVGTIRLFMDNALFFSFNEVENQKNYSLLSMKLKEEVNTLSHLTITTLFNHPRVKQIVQRKSTFVLTDDAKCLFVGKVLTISRNMSNEVTIEIEDLLGCLRDRVRPGYEYEVRTNSDYNTKEIGDGLYVGGRTDTITSLYYDTNDILNSNIYNSLYTIPSGTALVRRYDSTGLHDDEQGDEIIVQPTDPPIAETGNIDCEFYADLSKKDATNVAAFKNYLSVLYDDVNAEAGGVIIPFYGGSLSSIGTTSVKYVINDFTIWYYLHPKNANKYRTANGELKNGTYSSNIYFNFGKNILNFEVEPAVNDPVTYIAPSGTYKIPNDSSQRLVMRDTGQNSYSIGNSNAYKKYGRIEKNIDFGYIGEFNNYSSAQAELNSRCTKFINERLGGFGNRVTVTGIDPYYFDETANTDMIRLLSLVHVVSAPHDVDIFDFCLSREVDFFNHESDQYIIGPFIPSNYFEYSNTNVKRKTVEQIIADGAQYKKETGGLYTDNSYVRDALSL